MIAPHGTPAAAYAALGEFLTVDALPLMAVRIEKEWETETGKPSLVTYSAQIHVHEPDYPAWLERHGFTEADVERGDWTDRNDVLRVTSDSGVTLFALTPRVTDGGEQS